MFASATQSGHNKISNETAYIQDTWYANKKETTDAVEPTKQGFAVSTQHALRFWVVREFLA